MALYEMRSYLLYVGKLQEAVACYREFGWPAFEQGGFHDKLLGYFISDVGELNKLVHIWKFDDDADRRDHWRRVDRDEKFKVFAAKIRPLISAQKNELFRNAPWGPRP